MVAKKVKLPEYTPLEDVLSAETAFLQASCALDIAALWAVESRDAEQLGIVAAQYIELGSRLMGPGPDEDEMDEHDLTSESGFGFAPADMPGQEAANGRTNRAKARTKAKSPRWSISRIHAEHGEL